MRTKPSANERRLAKLLRKADERTFPTEYEERAAYLARRGVLAVCAATVPKERPLHKRHPWEPLTTYLRRLARGQR